MKKIKLSFTRSSASLSSAGSEIWVGQGLLTDARVFKKLHQLLKENTGAAGKDQGKDTGKERPSTAKVFIFADAKLEKTAQQLKSQAQRVAGLRVEIFPLQVQENLKNFENLAPLYQLLLDAGADRHSILVALGGGVVGDLVGFIAATYMRGIRWINIPTTLLGQVDSGVGGKTGVNLAQGKNLIGAFHQPHLVICDVNTLKTLTPRDRLSGLGEMIKYGLVYNAKFFRHLEVNWAKLIGLQTDWQTESLINAVTRCLQFKVRAIENDEEDRKGVREVLNFGHTLGHALETATGYHSFRHGEAVIQGMRAASWLSWKRGKLSPSDYWKIEGFLSRLPLPPMPTDLKPAQILKLVKADKKKSPSGKIRFILLTSIGTTTTESIDPRDVVRAFKALK